MRFRDWLRMQLTFRSEQAPTRPYDEDEFKIRVCTTRSRDGSRRPVPCVVCGSVQGLVPMHVIPKQRLKRIGGFLGMEANDVVALLHDRRNGVSLCRRHHDLHESAHQRIPGSKLPPTVMEFAVWLDSKLGTEECVLFLEENYR